MLFARRFALCLIAVFHLGPSVVHAQDWKPATIPDAWKSVPEGENLYAWYRCRVNVPVDWKGREIKLFAEAADDAREFFIGGTKVGQFGEFPPKYRSGLGETTRFPVKADAIAMGKENIVAIRVCITNHRTRREDLLLLLHEVVRRGRELAGGRNRQEVTERGAD